MTDMTLDVKLVRAIAEKEQRMYARYGLCIRVASVAHDGRSLICTVFQCRKSTFARPMDSVKMVQHAEQVVLPLLTAGYTPMISAVDWVHGEELRDSNDRPDPLDPIGLITAFKEAGLPYPRLRKAGRELPGMEMIQLPFWKRAFTMW